MNILILGSGGREHAFTWKIKQSQYCEKIFVLPGNAGTASIATNVNLSMSDFAGIENLVKKENINLVIVGPEAPLVEGVVDYFKKSNALKEVLIIGPDKQGAQLEGSKDFSKQFMLKYGIPAAASKTFVQSTLSEGLQYLENHTLPIVLKADGLAAGKGVIISEDRNEAKATLREMLENRMFGDASSKVVIEQFLKGIELSVFVLTDGVSYKILPEAKDYKRIGEEDTGLNTGGMGAVSPVPFADKVFLGKVEERIVKPTLEGLKRENIDYVGFIFIGLMNVEGEPYVIEYNARMGDPETEVVFPRISSDVLKLFEATGKKQLDKFNLEINPQTATTVMLVAGGYPGDYNKGDEISGLDQVKDVIPFHAGTKESNGKIVTNGGRVIALTGFGQNIEEALSKSLKAAQAVTWQGRYYRRDIGMDLKNL